MPRAGYALLSPAARPAVGSALYVNPDDLLERLQKSCDMQQIATDYNALFVGDECRVSPYRSAWQDGATEAEVRAFLSTRGMPLSDTPADHIGTLLLAASWIEDNAGDDENEAIETLFETYLLPWVGTFLGKVEAHAASPFWKKRIKSDLDHINHATQHSNLHVMCC